MKAVLYAQLNPQKTLAQLIQDRQALRLMMLGSLLLACCL